MAAPLTPSGELSGVKSALQQEKSLSSTEIEIPNTALWTPSGKQLGVKLQPQQEQSPSRPMIISVNTGGFFHIARILGEDLAIHSPPAP